MGLSQWDVRNLGRLVHRIWAPFFEGPSRHHSKSNHSDITKRTDNLWDLQQSPCLVITLVARAAGSEVSAKPTSEVVRSRDCGPCPLVTLMIKSVVFRILKLHMSGLSKEYRQP